MRCSPFALCLCAAIALASDESVTPRWAGGVYLWYYNPNDRPNWLEDQEALTIIRQAARAWEACGVELPYGGLTDRQAGRMDGENVVGWRTDGTKFSAWTSWRVRRNGTAIEADVVLYSNIFDLYRDKRLDARLELRKTVIHEFGHVLGLKHSATASDAMSVRVRTDPAWKLPSDDDIATCKRIYLPVR